PELRVLLEEEVEGGEAAENVLRQVGSIDAEDQVLAPAPENLALVLLHARPLGGPPERLRRDRQRVGAHPHVAAVEVDDAALLVNVEPEQLAAAEEEVAPVRAGVEAHDVVREHALVEVLADVP